MADHKSKTQKVHERRTQSGRVEVRKTASGNKIVGYAAKFAPSRSEDLGGFVEELDKNCFDRCLAGNVDCRALWNHDANHVLGRTTSGTLHLSVDSIGLRYEIDPPDTQTAKDLMVSMQRGDVTQSSFGFVCTRDSWREDPVLGVVRTVLEAELFDVSPVTYPAYPDATSGVRASTRTCPASLRSKLKRDDDEDDDFGQDGQQDEDDDKDDDCECDCDSCEQDRCEECSDALCDGEEDGCIGCGMRKLRKRCKNDPELDMVRLRLALAQRRAKAV